MIPGDTVLPTGISLVTGTCLDATSGPHPPGCHITKDTCAPGPDHELQEHYGINFTKHQSSLCSILQPRKQVLTWCPQVYRADCWRLVKPQFCLFSKPVTLIRLTSAIFLCCLVWAAASNDSPHHSHPVFPLAYKLTFPSEFPGRR